MVRDDQHLVLVGLMGTGKSTVGRVLAQRLQREFVDTDAAVEARAGRTVRQIFASDEGEPGFRRLETAVLLDALSSVPPVVIAAAGGVVLAPENRAALRSASAKVVWLSAEPALLVGRVKAAGHRPLLDADPEGMLATMAVDRQPLYREVAHVVVSVDGRTPADIADAVLR
jgi:shikimate kinase